MSPCILHASVCVMLAMKNSHLCLSMGYAAKFMCTQLASATTDMYDITLPLSSMTNPASLSKRFFNRLRFCEGSMHKSGNIKHEPFETIYGYLQCTWYPEFAPFIHKQRVASCPLCLTNEPRVGPSNEEQEMEATQRRPIWSNSMVGLTLILAAQPPSSGQMENWQNWLS